MYTYQADVYCDDCAEKICERLDAEREAAGLEPLNTGDDPMHYDSSEYPKYDPTDGESDTPTHCASGAECLNAERLDDGTHVGCLMGSLTEDGVEYVLERLRDDRRSEVVLLWMSHYEIEWPKDLYEIRLDNQGDDPTQITADVQGPYADEWCDATGSLDGGTWECADGPTFCYDILSWRPGLIDELVAEGYDLNLDCYGEPDDEEIAIATHAWECEDCEGDYSKAEEHLAAGGKVEDRRQLKLFKGE